jgi:hypothetical protein
MDVQISEENLLEFSVGKFKYEDGSKSMEIEVKDLVDGRSCSLQCQVLPKDKMKNTLMIFNRDGWLMKYLYIVS